jgi:hypothetical protein
MTCSEFRGWLGLALMMACGPSIATPSDDGSQDTDTATEPGTSTTRGTMPGSMTVGRPEDTDSPDETDTDGSMICEAGPFEGEIACEPQGSAEADFQITGLAEEGYFELDCNVTEVISDDPEAVTLVLDCGDLASDAVTIWLRSTIGPHRFLQVSVGQPLSIAYRGRSVGQEDLDQALTLRDPDGTLLAFGINASGLPPEELDLSPLALRVPSSSCEGVGADCLVVQRSALEIAFDGATELFYGGHAGGVGPFGSYFVVSDRVTRVACWPDDCGINYTSWRIRAVAYLNPGG